MGCGRTQRVLLLTGEVCHGISWQGWLQAQGSCVDGSKGDGSHATLGMLDANICLTSPWLLQTLVMVVLVSQGLSK